MYIFSIILITVKSLKVGKPLFYWIILSCLLHNNFFFVKKKEFTKGSWHETFWSKSFFSLLLRAHTKKREVCCWWEWIIRGDRIVGKQSIPLFVSRVRRYWMLSNGLKQQLSRFDDDATEKRSFFDESTDGVKNCTHVVEVAFFYGPVRTEK